MKTNQPKKPTYAQLMRERKKDHLDIIDKAAKITGLEEEVKGLKYQLEVERGFRKTQTNHIEDLHKERNEMSKQLMDFKITLKTILDGDYKNVYNRNLSLDRVHDAIMDYKAPF